MLKLDTIRKKKKKGDSLIGSLLRSRRMVAHLVDIYASYEKARV